MTTHNQHPQTPHDIVELLAQARADQLFRLFEDIRNSIPTPESQS